MGPVCSVDGDCVAANNEVCQNGGQANAACGMYSYCNCKMRIKAVIWKDYVIVVYIIVTLIVVFIVILLLE